MAFGKFTKPRGMLPEQEDRYETSLKAQEIVRQRESPESYAKRYGMEKDLAAYRFLEAYGPEAIMGRTIESARRDPVRFLNPFRTQAMLEEDRLLAESMRTKPLS